ncbi:hypothetical protein TDB9533_02138 [Thalassocella blandensis]|nr:hypothetical protein TDB9533_02138 [Thalassocella blandensis]
MMIRSFFSLLVTLVFSSNLYAYEVQDLALLKQTVLDYTDQHYRQAFGEDEFDSKVKIEVGGLDVRLRLAKCDDNLSFKLIEPPHNPHNVTVKTSCNGDKPWTVYIPATVNVFEDIIVANRSLARGDVLQEDDLTYKRVNTASVGRGLMSNMKSVKGMELKRSVRAGETIRNNYLKKPDIVLKGQPVVMSAKSRFLSVETTGVALVNGHIGERIKVKNDKSKRVVDAQVVGPGKVSVAVR